jgi:hypothetical protein
VLFVILAMFFMLLLVRKTQVFHL